MSNILRVTTDSQLSWEVSFASDETKEMYELLASPRDMDNCRIFIPTRTHNGPEFALDLFIPALTFIWTDPTCRTDNLACEIILSLAAFFLDLITLPIRCFTSIFRTIENARKEPHPLYKWLSQNGAPEEITASEILHVDFSWCLELENQTWQNRRALYVNKHPSHDHRLTESLFNGAPIEKGE